MKCFLALLALTLSAQAEDVIFLRDGGKRVGQLAGRNDNSFRLSVPLPPRPNAPPNSPSASALVSIPKSDVTHIEFSPDPARDRLLESDQLPDIAELWMSQLPWLEVPRSPAARIGCAYGNLLLKRGNRENSAKALEVFRAIEAHAWDKQDQLNANQGRLRAMVATGQAAEAVKEAFDLAKTTENPAVLIEAKYLLAEADAAALRKLVEDNPRWQEDVHVLPEHARLHHQALDQFLFPCLFFGSESLPAARGLWEAARLHDFVGEKDKALECVRDILTIYPDTPYAALAKTYRENLPQKLLAHDPEQSARTEQTTPPPAPEATPESQPPKKTTRKKSHENKPSKKSR